MPPSSYEPLFELTRGDIVESVHYGAIAVVDAFGRLITSHGDPNTVSYLRSTAKPFQLIPFIENGGAEYYNLGLSEIALMCASHSGTDQQVAKLISLQEKTSVRETDLLCGVHPPIDKDTEEALRQRGEKPTSNRHNCSGKHTGMLAYALMQNWSTKDYLNPSHPVQQKILQAFCEICDLSLDQVAIGVDGCSAPNFAVPLSKAALAYARLCDSSDLTATRSKACQTIVSALIAHPDMVAGPGRFDTRLMEVASGRIVAKGGAEGYQGIGLLPGVLGPGSPALGMAIKVSDGDSKSRVRPAIVLEVLRQLGVLKPSEMEALSDFGPTYPVHNWRELVVGQARPRLILSDSR